jgi:hypothetical protein
MQKTIRSQEDAIHFARAFAANAYHIMIWAGPPGLSKTRTIEEVLGKENYVYLSGEVSPYQLYKDVYANREAGKIVIDDVETLIKNPQGSQLLKSLCQTEEVKSVGWHKATTDLKKDDIPRQYETSARFCLICNDEVSLRKPLGPVIDRGVLVRFEYPAAEVHRMVGQWLHVNGIDREVYDFIGAHLAFAKTPSARLYKTASETKRSNPGIDWREAVLETFGLDEDEIEVALLFSDPAFSSNAQRWKEFERRGFGSRAKFYRLARAMCLIGTEPKGNDADESVSPVSSTSPSIDPSQIMEALGFQSEESRLELIDPADPSTYRVGPVGVSWPTMTYAILIRNGDQVPPPEWYVRADTWEDAKQFADYLKLQPGARIEEVYGCIAPAGTSIIDIRKVRRERKARSGRLCR